MNFGYQPIRYAAYRLNEGGHLEDVGYFGDTPDDVVQQLNNASKRLGIGGSEYLILPVTFHGVIGDENRDK